MEADLFTKALPKETAQKHWSRLRGETSTPVSSLANVLISMLNDWDLQRQKLLWFCTSQCKLLYPPANKVDLKLEELSDFWLYNHSCKTFDGGSSPSLAYLASNCKLVLCWLHITVPCWICKMDVFLVALLSHACECNWNGKSCDQCDHAIRQNLSFVIWLIMLSILINNKQQL